MWTCQWTGKPVELCIHVQLSQLAALKIWNWNKSITVSCGTRAGVLSTLCCTELGVVVFLSWSDVQWCWAMHTTMWRKYPVVGAVVNDEWKLATVQHARLYPQLIERFCYHCLASWVECNNYPVSSTTLMAFVLCEFVSWLILWFMDNLWFDDLRAGINRSQIEHCF